MSPTVPEDYLRGMPAYLEQHPTANAYLALVMTCNLSDLAVRGLIRARESGQLKKIEGAEERGFPQGKYWNRLVDGEELTGVELSLAAQPLMDSIHGIAQKRFRKFYDGAEGIDPPAPAKKIMAAASGAIKDIAKWLEAPSQNRRSAYFSRSTDLINREALFAGRPAMWLVRLNGWDEVTLFERGTNCDWGPVKLESEPDAPALG